MLPAMDDRDGVIWLDGELVPWRDAKIHVLTHTLHYGFGVFEGVRAYATLRGPAIFRLNEHTTRLFESAKILKMVLPFTAEQIREAQCSVVRENSLADGYLRPMAFLGSEGMGLHAKGLKVHLMVAGWSWPPYLGEDALEKGIRCKISSFSRHHVNVSLCRAKANGHYLNSMLALQEANDCGYDEALMLDVNGYLAEGTGENLFMIKNGALYTPALTSALDGITRKTIFSFAEELNIPVYEKQLTRDSIYIADEAFLCGTAAEVTPICEVDGRAVGNGERGSITAQLQSMYYDQVHGRRDKNSEWLTLVH